ncbi:MAG TPA: hypothetical protein VFR11_14315 [Micromonosporaceae bacterium]|nr:hypothetical protein [Micromonosporaceae bacterium]
MHATHAGALLGASQRCADRTFVVASPGFAAKYSRIRIEGRRLGCGEVVAGRDRALDRRLIGALIEPVRARVLAQPAVLIAPGWDGQIASR